MVNSRLGRIELEILKKYICDINCMFSFILFTGKYKCAGATEIRSGGAADEVVRCRKYEGLVRKTIE